MARARRPVQSLQEAIRAQPQATPVDLGTTAAPIDLPIFDFAAISSTLADYVAQQSRERNARMVQEGERFVADNALIVQDLQEDASQIKDPAEQDRFLKAQFDALVKQGILSPPQHPYAQLGANRAAGRLMGSLYRERLRGRLAELSASTDANGQPLPAPDVEAAIAQEWEAVSGSPAVRNFYGGQEALGLKEQADEEFRTTVATRRGEAQMRDYEDQVQREIGAEFDAVLSANPVVTSETLSGITAIVDREVAEHYLPRPRELVLEALELSIQRQAAVDPDAALRAVYAAQDLIVGDVRLGDDRSGVGLRLQELTRRVREQAAEHSVTELRREEGRRKLAVQTAQLEYVPLLVKAKQEGQSVSAVADRLAEKYLREDPDGRGAFVVEALRDDAMRLDAARQSDQGAVGRITRLIADGELDAADALIKASTLTGPDYATLLGSVADRRASSDLVEQSPLFQTYAGQYNELKPQGLAPDVQQRVDERVQELRNRMRRDYVSVVQKAGKPDREWLEERWQADKAAIQQIEAEVRGDQDKAEVEVQQKMARFQDALDLINQAEARGTFTVRKAQEMRDKNVAAAAGRQSLLNSPAVQDAEQALARRMQDEPELFEASLRLLRDRHAAAVDDFLANPSVDPRSFQQRSDAEVRRVATELEEQLFPSVTEGAEGPSVQVGAGKAERALAAGQSAEEVTRSAARLQADARLVTPLNNVLADPRSRERLTSKHPFFDSVRHPALPDDLYRYAAGWYSGLDPIFGSPVRRADVEYRARRALHAVDPAELPSAALGVATLLGIDAPAVLAERFELSLPEADQALVRQEIAMLSSNIASLPPETKAERLAALNTLLEPVVVDMTGQEYAPLSTPFFRSLAAFEAFAADPAYPDLLRRVGIDPEDATEVALFEENQAAAIARINP